MDHSSDLFDDPSELESFLQSCLDNANLLDSVESFSTGVGSGGAAACMGSSLSPIPSVFAGLPNSAARSLSAPGAPAHLPPPLPPAPNVRTKAVSVLSSQQRPAPLFVTKAALKQQSSHEITGAVPPPPHLPTHAAVAPFVGAATVSRQSSPASACSPLSTAAARSPGQSPAPPAAVSSPSVAGATLTLSAGHRSPPVVSASSLTVVSASHQQLSLSMLSSSSSPSSSIPAINKFPPASALPFSNSSMTLTNGVMLPAASAISGCLAAVTSSVSRPLSLVRPAVGVVGVASSVTALSSHSPQQRVTAAASVNSVSVAGAGIPVAVSLSQYHQQLTQAAALRTLVSSVQGNVILPHPAASSSIASATGFLAAAGGAILPAPSAVSGLPMITDPHSGALMQLVCAGGNVPSLLPAVSRPTHKTSAVTPTPSSNSRQPQLLPKTLAPAASISSVSGALKHPLMLAATSQPALAASQAAASAAPLLLTPVVVPQPGGGVQLQYMLREQPQLPPALMLPTAPRGPQAVLLPTPGGGHTTVLLPTANAGVRLLTPPPLLAVQSQQPLSLLGGSAGSQALLSAGVRPKTLLQTSTISTTNTSGATGSAVSSGKKRSRTSDQSTVHSPASAAVADKVNNSRRAFVDLEDVMKKSGILSDIAVDEGGECQQTCSAAAVSTAVEHQVKPPAGASDSTVCASTIAPVLLNGPVLNGSLCASGVSVPSIVVPSSVSVGVLGSKSAPLRQLAPQLLPYSVRPSVITSSANRRRDSRRRDVPTSRSAGAIHASAGSSRFGRPAAVVTSSRRSPLVTKTAAMTTAAAKVAVISSAHNKNAQNMSVASLTLSSNPATSPVEGSRSRHQNQQCSDATIIVTSIITSATTTTTITSATSTSITTTTNAAAHFKCAIASGQSPQLKLCVPAAPISPPSPPQVSSLSPSPPPLSSTLVPNCAEVRHGVKRSASDDDVAGINGRNTDSDIEQDKQDIAKIELSAHIQRTQDNLMARLHSDHEAVLCADKRAISCPFSDCADAISRLCRYHVFSDDKPSSSVLDDAAAAHEEDQQMKLHDQLFSARAQYLLHRKQLMCSKYRRLLLKDSMKVHATSEIVQLLRCVNQYDREQLELARRSASISSDTAVQGSVASCNGDTHHNSRSSNDISPSLSSGLHDDHSVSNTQDRGHGEVSDSRPVSAATSRSCTAESVHEVSGESPCSSLFSVSSTCVSSVNNSTGYHHVPSSSSSSSCQQHHHTSSSTRSSSFVSASTKHVFSSAVFDGGGGPVCSGGLCTNTTAYYSDSDPGKDEALNQAVRSILL